ncbi:hypothetical protein L2E82_45018 [Cichorium intybus]|uniref:Uncharacterized protein n=1 Tax=Cichorium intybus TaxID=13427 RepID=A0ACB8ZS63_CICIN|nr:hypothetical protein L2E82_45018 [Cichorium intybus]
MGWGKNREETLIPVEPQGVVQFGSNQKILERMEFVNQTKRIFQELVNGGGPEFDSCSLNSRSLISSEFPNLVFDSRSLPDFGIPDEIFRAEDFHVSQWCSPLKNDLFSPPLGFNPFDSDEKHESLTISCTDVDHIENNGVLEAILAPIIRGRRSNFHSFSSESKPKLVNMLTVLPSVQKKDCSQSLGLKSCWRVFPIFQKMRRRLALRIKLG